MQVFDTHRLSYKRAKLRAWSDIAKTVPVKFYDITDPDTLTEAEIGTEVVTDSVGYLFYGNGTTKVNCLAVHEACIIEVSLDGGSSWLIQWIMQGDGAHALTADDIYNLSYWDDTHTLADYNPIAGPSQLPDYLRRNEFTPGIWGEGEIVLGAGDEDFEINQWTHTIQVDTDAEDTIAATGTQRAAQVIVIRVRKDVIMTIDGINWALTSGHTYLWWWKKLVTDISFVTDGHINDLIDAKLTPRSITYYFKNQDPNAGDQTITPETDITPDADSIICVLRDSATLSGDINLKLKAPTRLGISHVIVTTTRTDTSGAFTVNLQINSNTPVLLGTYGIGDASLECSFMMNTFIAKGIDNLDHKYVAISITYNNNTAFDLGTV